eukprot:1326487-Prymnesium_polylepis.1
MNSRRIRETFSTRFAQIHDDGFAKVLDQIRTSSQGFRRVRDATRIREEKEDPQSMDLRIRDRFSDSRRDSRIRERIRDAFAKVLDGIHTAFRGGFSADAHIHPHKVTIRTHSQGQGFATDATQFAG